MKLTANRKKNADRVGTPIEDSASIDAPESPLPMLRRN
jgi:hypothetical protein